MLLKRIIPLTLSAIIALASVSCKTEKTDEGPFFGNGFHNGWADQTSIVIWTRLTKYPELNSAGQPFLVPSADEHRRLDAGANADSIYKAQIPEGLTLDQMEGACPGSPGEVKLTCYPLKNPDKKIVTDWSPVETERNFTRQWKLENLDPATKYVMEIEARKTSSTKVSAVTSGSFRTPPDPSSIGDLNFYIVTCHDYPRRDDPVNGHKMYKAMGRMLPDFFVHTGDVEYYDKASPFAMTEELMRFKWDRIFALPYQRNFYRQVTTYWMKDDHDVLKNDAFPGSHYGTVSWDRGLDIFDKEQFPYNNLPYKTIRWGKDLQIWITEGRNYRSRNDDPDGPGKTIWGGEQKEWLFKTIRESDAAFKLLISPDPILGPDRTNKGDNYANKEFKFEGDEIRKYLNEFDNIFICNGDRHWQYVTHPEKSNLWEFSCGAGSDEHAGGWPPDEKRPEHRFLRVKGGFLHGTVSRKDSETILNFKHYDVDGNVVHEEVFTRKL